jgi:hypothetical protein
VFNGSSLLNPSSKSPLFCRELDISGLVCTKKHRLIDKISPLTLCIARHKTHTKLQSVPQVVQGTGNVYTHSRNPLNSMSKYYQKFRCDARHWTTHLQKNSSTSHGLALLLKVLHELENQKVYTKVLPSNIGYTQCHSSLALNLDRDKVKKRLEHLLPYPPLFEPLSIFFTSNKNNVPSRWPRVMAQWHGPYNSSDYMIYRSWFRYKNYTVYKLSFWMIVWN